MPSKSAACQRNNVGCRPFATQTDVRSDVGEEVNTGRIVLTLSFVDPDPYATSWGVSGFKRRAASVLSRKFADKVARFSGGSSRLWQSIQRAANLRCACG